MTKKQTKLDRKDFNKDPLKAVVSVCLKIALRKVDPDDGAIFIGELIDEHTDQQLSWLADELRGEDQKEYSYDMSLLDLAKVRAYNQALKDYDKRRKELGV
tara:strand:- start:255 stop:557 length:303 start_codon:yes stop_codon:yes gene_type:complete